MKYDVIGGTAFRPTHILIASCSDGAGVSDRTVKATDYLSLVQRVRMLEAYSSVFPYRNSVVFLNHNSNKFTFLFQLT